jgi:tripartite-type tricarboxylate transporter receptor subunit TctC
MMSRIVCRIAGAGLLGAAVLAAAQTYPNRQVTVIASLAAGTGLDIITRMYSARLSQNLGRPVLVDNKAGGAQIVALQAQLAAPADGHTLAVVTSGGMAINPTMYKTLPYHPQKDFVPISLYLKSPYILVVNPKVPANNTMELIRHVRENPGKLSYTSIGPSGAQRLAMEMLNARFGMESVNVPYKESPRLMADMASGEVQLGFVEAGASQAFIRDGRLRALAVSSQTRLTSLPDVPTIAESANAPDFEAVSWHVLITRAGTPDPVVARLHDEMKRIMAEPEIQGRMRDIGLIPFESPPVEGIRKYIASEESKWGAVIRKLGFAGTQ